MISFSVIICTYNPAPGIFKKCLTAITRAAEIKKPLEVIIIDNNSSVPISKEEYINEFLHRTESARVVREEKQGLTQARLRGIKESKGQLLIFIDDDNIIDNYFFSSAVKVAQDYPFIGAFSGQVLLEYDKQPPLWTKKYWGMLVHRELTDNYWSNIIFNTDSMPCGAGLCITREVADYYYHLHESGKRNFYLDRSKGSLLSGGDNDLAMCACDIGKGMGLFKDLKLNHHIPENRFTLDYLKKLAHGIYYSTTVLQYLRTGKVDDEGLKERLKHLIRQSMRKSHDRTIQDACRKGLQDARKMIRATWLK
jgi:glycosyltransferase involved in cell wall biosynthesis